MALIDDIEFYGSRVDADDISPAEAAYQLYEVSYHRLTVDGARKALDSWQGLRARLCAEYADVRAVLRALEECRPVLAGVQRGQAARMRERALRFIRRTARDVW